MNRARILFVMILLLGFMGCDAPTTAPELATAGPAQALETTADDPGGLFGPFPVEYPFMPYPDGYQFKNFGGAADWVLFQETFGYQVNAWSIFDRKFFDNSFVTKFGGGQCYGFAVTAGMFHRGSYGPHPSEFQRGATTPFPIPRSGSGGGEEALDEDIERHISKYYYFQFSPEIWPQRIGKYGPEDAEPIIAAIEAEQEGGWEELWELAIWGPWGGHGVNILNVDRTDDGAVFTVYDNNAPFRETTNSPGFRRFYVGADGYTYGNREVTRAAVYPVSPHERGFVNKWWGPQSLADLQIWVSIKDSPGSFVIHTDNLGRRTGHTSSGILDEIPGAQRVRAITGAVNDDWIEPIEYYLPPGNYTVDLKNSSTGSLGYHLFAGDALFSLETSGPGPAEGRVARRLEEDAFSFAAMSPVENLQLEVAQALNGDEERAVHVSGVSLPKDGSLLISPAVNVSGFNLVLEGAEAVLGEVSLTAASPSGALSLSLPGVQLTEGAPLRIEPWDWSRITRMPVYTRAFMQDGRVLLKAYNSTAMNLDELLNDMLGYGAIPNRGIATSIRKQVKNAPSQVLVNHLTSLVTEGMLTQSTADLILATAEAAAGGGVSVGRFVK